MSDCRRLTSHQIAVLKSLVARGASTRPVSLHARQRGCTLPLWRREIVEIWYRQVPHELQGPFYGLTLSGAQLASHFFQFDQPAPRGLSGAEKDPW